MTSESVFRREVRWERMFRDELEASFAACPVLYFTYGLCEPHGPQNALGLDELKAHAVACRAAEAYGGIVAPAHYWHIHELASDGAWAHEAIGQVERSWLTTVPPWHYFKTALYHIRSADVHGFHGAILMSGHSAMAPEDLGLLAELVQPHVGTRLAGILQGEESIRVGDHAGKVETSMLWAVEPDCVDLSRLPEPGAPGPHFAMGPDAYESDRRWGEQLVADDARWLGAKAHDLLAAYQHQRREHRLRTFADVERLWREVVEPALPRFRTMQAEWWDDPPPPPPADSVWYANSVYPDEYRPAGR